MKIAHKLFVSFSVFVLLIWIVGYFAISKGQEILKTHIGQTSASLAAETMRLLEKDIYSMIELSQEYSRDLTLRGVASESNQEFEKLDNIQTYIDQKDQQWTSVSKETITPFMQRLMSNQLSLELIERSRFYEEKHGHKVFGEIFATNKYGVNIAQTGKTTDYRQDDEEWWQKAKRNGVNVADIEYDESAGIYSTNIAIRIEDKNGNFMGVMKVVVNIEEIHETIDRASTRSEYETLEIHLINRENKVVYCKYYKFLEDLSDDLPFEKMDGDRGYFEEKRFGGDKGKSLFSYAVSKGYEEFRGLGWILLIEYRTQEIYAPIRKLRNGIIVISLVVSIFAMLASVFISGRISNPVTKLKNAMTAIGKGKLDTEIEVESNDEFGELADSFKKMVEDLTRTTTSIDNLNKEIVERKRAEQKIEASLKEKEVLLTELHHRVKNNMQIITSLLQMRGAKLKDPEAVEAFRDSRDRVRAMILIHETLYQSEDFANIELSDYVTRLANNLFLSVWAGREPIALEKNLEPVFLPLDRAVPCGLVMNELLTNTLKHAFPEGTNGQINISVAAIDPGEVEIIISDNGVGFPGDTNFRNAAGMGLELVVGIVEKQLGGQIELNQEEGTEFRIRFKTEKNTEEA